MSNAEASVQSADSKGRITMTLENAVQSLKIETEVNANTSFHQFPRFPTEIRLCIWRSAIEALPERIIPLSEVLTYTKKPGKNRNRIYTYISTRPHPTLSTVNREARTAVFENLLPLFQARSNHTFITVCPEKDILLWDASCATSGNLEELKRFANAVGLETSQEIRKLAFETPVDWIGGGSRYHDLMMVLMERDARDLLEMFPKIETLFCVPLGKWKRFVGNHRAKFCIATGYDAAKFHVGELEFVPRGKSLDNVLHARLSRREIDGPTGLSIKYLQLGIVGGEKQLVWEDSVNRHPFWKLVTEEEKEKARAKAPACT